MSRTDTVIVTTYTPNYPPLKWRPALVREAGWRLHPDTVTAAWYAAACPQNFRPHLSLADRTRWFVSRFLRGC